MLGLLLTEFFPDPTHKGATGMADGGSGDADTSNSGSTWAASEANLRDHAVRLRKRRGRYCLRRSCEGYDQPAAAINLIILILPSRNSFLQENSAAAMLNTS